VAAGSEVKHCGQCGAELQDGVDENETLHQYCVSCGWRWYSPPTPVVLVLVTTQDRQVVYCRKDRQPPGMWSVVSGFIPRGEAAEVTALREVKEETNLDAEIVHFAKTHVFNMLPDQLVIAYHARVIGGDPRAGDDVDHVEVGPPDVTRLFPGSTSFALVSGYIEGCCAE
jgi:NADH pyrophosphatase NudC (nudix superfamily)